MGLFGYASGAHIKNLAIEGVSISSSHSSAYVGAIAGIMEAGSISNSYMTGSVTGASHVGGLTGYLSSASSMRNSYALGSVTGSIVGGLAGSTAGSLLETSSIGNSFALGSVTGSSHTGGLVGFMDSTSIRNSFALSAVKSSSHAGGLTGQMSGGSIHDSYAMGSVSSSTSAVQQGVGGLVGDLSGSITNSYATGSLSLLSNLHQVGGLVGRIHGTSASISASYVNQGAEHNQGGSDIALAGKRWVGNKENTDTAVQGKVYGKTMAQLQALTSAGTGWSSTNWAFASSKLSGVQYVQNPSTAANAPQWCGAEGNSDELPVCGTLILGQQLGGLVAGGGACSARDLKSWLNGVCEQRLMSQVRTCTDGARGDGSCNWSCLGLSMKKWKTDTSCLACKARTLTQWADDGCTAPNSGYMRQTRTCTPGTKGNNSCAWSCAGIAEEKTVADDDCLTVTLGACVEWTLGSYESTSTCSGGQRLWTRSCTDGTQGDGGCDWDCSKATTQNWITDPTCTCSECGVWPACRARCWDGSCDSPCPVQTCKSWSGSCTSSGWENCTTQGVTAKRPCKSCRGYGAYGSCAVNGWKWRERTCYRGGSSYTERDKASCTKCGAWRSCNGGTKSRTCYTGGVASTETSRSGCPQSCNSWNAWSSCSSRGWRTRSCTTLGFSDIEREACKYCLDWDSCSGGSKSRTCYTGGVASTETSTEDCSQNCDAWTDWSDWSACNTSGWKTRSRSCKTPGFTDETETQQAKCKDYGPWSAYGSCETGGWKYRTRSVTEGGVSLAPERESAECTYYGPYGSCDSNGEKSRTVTTGGESRTETSTFGCSCSDPTPCGTAGSCSAETDCGVDGKVCGACPACSGDTPCGTAGSCSAENGLRC